MEPSRYHVSNAHAWGHAGTRPLSPLAGEYVPQIGYGEARSWQEAGSRGRVLHGDAPFRPARVVWVSEGAACPSRAISRPIPSSSGLGLSPPAAPMNPPCLCPPLRAAIAVCHVPGDFLKLKGGSRRSTGAAAAPKSMLSGQPGRLRCTSDGRIVRLRTGALVLSCMCWISIAQTCFGVPCPVPVAVRAVWAVCT